MRPRQECLLLASGADGPAGAQVAQLREFVRAVLARRSPAGEALRDVDLPGGPDRFAMPPQREAPLRALRPVEPAQAMVAFDLAALLHAPHLRQHAVLPPLTLSRDLARVAAAADPMPVLAMLQDVLRHAWAVVAFDAAARDLALLGAPGPAVLPLPALPPAAPPRPGDPGRVTVWLFDHEPARGRAAAVAGAVAEALPGATVTVADAAPATPPTCPGLHLHLGTGRSPAVAPWRVVDSFAARCPVVHLADGPSRAGSAEVPGMAVEPMRTGILAGTAAEAVAGLARLAADPALVDVFRSHAGQAAEAFNRRIEDRLRALLP